MPSILLRLSKQFYIDNKYGINTYYKRCLSLFIPILLQLK
nr:MAG TPA: hypothetical protein [Caudoviricetes sp.]